VNRLKPAILLLSFLIGTLQPALPLIEYHLFKESIIERFCVNRDVSQSDCEGSCYLANQIEENQERDGEQLSLNLEFYPIAVSLAATGDLLFCPDSGSVLGYPLYGSCGLSPEPANPPPRTV